MYLVKLILKLDEYFFRLPRQFLLLSKEAQQHTGCHS